MPIKAAAPLTRATCGKVLAREQHIDRRRGGQRAPLGHRGPTPRPQGADCDAAMPSPASALWLRRPKTSPLCQPDPHSPGSRPSPGSAHLGGDVPQGPQRVEDLAHVVPPETRELGEWRGAGWPAGGRVGRDCLLRMAAGSPGGTGVCLRATAGDGGLGESGGCLYGKERPCCPSSSPVTRAEHDGARTETARAIGAPCGADPSERAARGRAQHEAKRIA